MRLGLLGPSQGDLPALGKAADLLLNTLRVDRAVYLGSDGALERAVQAWARKLVGDRGDDEGLWARAFTAALEPGTEALERLLAMETARRRLRALEMLPDERTRALEMLGDRVALLIHDKAHLDEEDILAANYLVYGRSDAPSVRRIGARWFLTPGVLGAASGVGVIDDDGDDAILTFYEPGGRVLATEVLALPRGTKMRVQGEP